MSECSYDYRFYFSSPKSAQAAKKIAIRSVDDEDIAEQLGFLACLKDETESLDAITLTPQYLELSLSTRAGEELNHRLVRASKEIGSEFCIVDAFNDQVGEGGTLYLWRGQTVHGKERTELLTRYQPLEPVRQAIVDDNLKLLNSYLHKGLDVNQSIDGKSLLETAYQYRKLRIFNYLLKHKANINIPAAGEPSLLLYLVKDAEPEDSDYVQLLVRRGADLTPRDQSGASFLWYISRLNPSLHRTLVQQKTKLHRPNEAYSSTKPLTNLSVALQHGDQAKIAELFKSCARNKEWWLDIAQQCATYNYMTPVDVLIKNGLLKKPDTEQRLISLLTHALYSQELDGFLKLYKLALDQAVDLSRLAGEFLDQLLVKNGSEAAIHSLLKKYPKALTLDSFNIAIDKKKPTYLKILLRYKNPFEGFEEQFDMPLLHYSIGSLTVDTLEILVEHGADIEHQYQGQNVLSYCIDNNAVERSVKQYLLAHSTSLTIKEIALLRLKLNDIEGFQKIWHHLKDKSSTDTGDDSLLMIGCRQAHLKIVQFLLAQKVDLKIKNSAGETALSIAVTSQDSKLVKLLLAAGANPNALYATMSDAEQAYDEDGEGGDEGEDEEQETRPAQKFGLDSLFEDKFADALDTAQELSKGATCLMYAASKGLDSICKLLIKHGADLWYKDDSNQDALMYAILHNKKVTTDLILQTESAASVVKEKAAELINIAAMGGNAYAIRGLVGMGVSPNLPADDESLTPLIIATILSDRTHRYDAIDALIDAGADLGKTDNQGRTALIYACIENNQRAIARLLEAGGFPDHVDKEAKTAYDHFQTHAVDTTDFKLDRLKPSLKIVTVYKALIYLRKFVLKRVIPTYIVLSIIAVFSPSLATNVLALASIALAIEIAITIRKLVRKPTTGPPSVLALGLAAIGKAYDSNLRKQDSTQAIIDSWND